ncbi:MAG TPA: hypothetical protein VFT29_09445 [Gemmatimonadaceae bacterium]|nr:hypothetical protein [Gemmatimonadaceae bacterium]
MTTHAITCAQFSDQLMAYMEQQTDDATRVSLERHALACATCGPLLADLRELRVEAANLAELTPSRDLWSGIAARIETPVVPIRKTRWTAAERAVIMRRSVGSVLIAASLVAAAGLGYLAARTRPNTPGGQVASVTPKPDTPKATMPESTSSPAAEIVPSTSVAQVSDPAVSGATTSATPTPAVLPAAYTRLVADYDREIARLRALLEQRRGQLDPVTIAIIEKNLQVIDTAISDCKRAIARDPASRFLIESLNQSLQSKLELMRTAAQLPSRT